jgi:hypothetical protein
MVITIDVFLKLCAGISCVGLALSYLIKAVNSLKKPVTDMNDRFQHYDECFQMDKRRLDSLEKVILDNIECNKLLLESVHSMLSHFEDGNSTNALREEKRKIEQYLYNQIKVEGV